MNRTRFILLCLTFALSSMLAAQDKAIAILEKAGAVYQESNGSQASFVIDIQEPGGVSGGQIEGKIQLKKNMFKLEIDEMITWFDGKNQWLYIKEAQEVNLSNPGEEELLSINPINVFQWYKHGFTPRFVGEKKLDEKNVLHILQTPQESHSDVKSIDVYFDKSNYQPVYVRIQMKDLSGSVIRISNYKTGLNYPDALFVFQQKEYPGAEVIDLR